MKFIDYRKTKFVMVSQTLIKDQELTAQDKSVYLTICMYANNDTKAAFPGIDTMAKTSGVSRNTVSKSIKRLCERGYLHKEQRNNKRGEFTTNIYYLLDK